MFTCISPAWRLCLKYGPVTAVKSPEPPTSLVRGGRRPAGGEVVDQRSVRALGGGARGRGPGGSGTSQRPSTGSLTGNRGPKIRRSSQTSASVSTFEASKEALDLRVYRQRWVMPPVWRGSIATAEGVCAT